MASLFNGKKSNIISQEVLSQFEDFKEKFNSTTLSAEALVEQFGEVDQRIVEYAKTCKNGEMTTEGFKASVEGLSFSAKAGKVALQGLAMAGNMIAFMAITKTIQVTIKAFDDYIHRVERANEATKEAIQNYESISSEVEDLESKIKELNDQINELDPITDPDDIANIKEETAELEKQLAILKERQRIADFEADKEAQKSLGMTEASRYKTNTTYDGFAGVEMQEVSYVTKDEELLNAIEAYDEYKDKVDTANQALADMAETKEYSQKEWDKQNSVVTEYSKKMEDARIHANELSVEIEQEKKGLNGATEESQKLVEKTDFALNKYNDFLNSINGVTDGLNEESNAMSDVPEPDFKWDYTGTITQLDQMKDKFSTLDSVMAKLYDKDASIGFEDYSSIAEVFKDVEGLDVSSYIKQLQDAGQNAEQVKSVIRSLIDEYLSLTGVLNNVNEEDQKLIISFLEEMGVENANAIVTAQFAAQQLYLKLNTQEGTDAIYEQINGLVQEEEATGLTCSALFKLVAQEQIFNNSSLDVSGKIAQLEKLAGAFGITADAARSSQAYLDAARFAGRYGGKEDVDAVVGDMKEYYQSQIEKKFGDLGGSYNGGPSTQKTSNSGSSSKSKEDEKEKDIMSELNSEMDKYQSKLGAIKEARETYNQHGKISIDQAQEILDADFKLLAAYGDEEAALKDLGKAKLNEMQIQLARNAIDTINNIKTEAEAAQYLAGANENLTGTSLSATEALLQQAVAAAKLRGTMQGAAAETILKGYQNGAMMLGQVDFSFDTSELQKTALDKFKDWFSTLFDWIEIKLEKQAEKIERYIKRAESRMDDGKYTSAAEWYKKAINASAVQSGYQQEASKKYQEKANSVLKKAVDDGVVSQDEANGIAYHVKNGTMDISEYSDEIKEVISAYKEWYEKSKEASEAIEGLHDKIREYVKALKDVRDAHRDAKIDSLELFASIGTSTIANTLGTKNDQLYYQDVQLYKKNTAYDNAVKNIGKDTNSLGNDAKRSIKDALKSSDNKEYKNALNHANKAVKEKKPVSDADLKVIKKHSIMTYNKLYAYNEALKNLKTARLEQAVNYAATSAEIMSNRDEKLDNRRQSRLDDIDLLNQKSDNAQSAEEANKFLDQAAEKYDKVAGNANVAIEKRKGIIKDTSSSVSSKKGTTTKYKTLKSNDNKRKLVDKYIKEAKAAVKSKTPIKASTLAGLAKYYSEGYITKAFYESCVDYNNAIESLKQLELQKEIDEETAKAEKAAIGTQKVSNVEQEYTNKQTAVSDKTSMITAKQETKTTRGLSLNASDYKELLAQNKSSKDIYDSEIIALRKVINENLESGYWTTTSQEYLDAMSALHGYEVKAQECVTEQERLNNKIAQLPYDKFEKALELLDAIADNNKSAIDLKAAKSEDLSEADYLQQISDNNDQIKKLGEERRQAFADYQKALADPDGVYGGKTADEWKEKYLSLGTEINNTLSENEKLKDSLRDDVYWRPFNRMKAELERLKGVLEGINNLLSDDMMFNSKGDLTDYGISKIAILVKEYENARDAVQNYADGIVNLNELMKENHYSDEEYKEKLAEMQTGILSSASNMKSVMGQIVDMFKTMAQTELDELFKLIDARNKALSAKKAYYDYDKTIRDKTKDIQSLRSQIDALEGIDTSEAKAKKATLQAQLSEAQEDLDDTVNDHMFELSQDALNDLKDTLQDAFDDKWDHIGGNLEEISKLMSYANTLSGSSASAINSTLQNLLEYYGIDIEKSGMQSALLNEQVSKTRQELKDTIEERSIDSSANTIEGIKNVIHETFDDKLTEITEDLENITSSDKLDGISENLDNIAKSGGKLDEIHMTMEEFRQYMIAQSKNQEIPLDASTIVIKPDNDMDKISAMNYYVHDSDVSNMIPRDIQNIQRFASDMDNSYVSSGRTGNTTIEQHYDALINVEGNVDKYVVDDIKRLGSDLLKDRTFMKGTYEYTSKEIVRDARRVGIKV